jgi:hypothetical protein
MLIFRIKTLLLPTMSTSSSTRSVHANVPFVLLSTPQDLLVGTDVIFNDPDNFDYGVPPYRLTEADIVPTPGRPLLTVLPEERGLSTIRVSAQAWPSLYFLAHPAIYRLLPFIRVPERIYRTDPAYLATILDRAVPVFVSLLRVIRAIAILTQSRLYRSISSVLMRLFHALTSR